MDTIVKIAMSMFGLIFLYLAINNADAVNNIINTLSEVTDNQITALQGR